MRLKDPESRIVVDGDFACASAGAIRPLAADLYEVDYLREELPAWFQSVLEEYWDGGGVPKEYAFCVRVQNCGDSARRVGLRFRLSPKGAAYMAPPCWIQRRDGWAWVPPEDTSIPESREHIELAVEVEPGESVLVASAPYIAPEAVCEKAKCFAEHFDNWTYREIGETAQGRPIVALESEPRPLKVLVEATMQSCEPVAWGILHVAHWLTIPTARTRRLLEHVQFCLLPMTNPDGAAEGRSVTNSLGQVPKFEFNRIADGLPAALETQAIWDYNREGRHDAHVEVHAHFRWERMWRSVGLQARESLPEALREKSNFIEAAIDANYPESLPENAKRAIDPREPDKAVYGIQHRAEQCGTLSTWIQAMPETIESHAADVQEFVETIAEALILWKYGPR